MYAATFEKWGEAVSLATDEIASDDEISYEISAKTKLTLLIYPQFSAWGFPEKQTTVTLIDVNAHSLAFYGRVTDVQDSMDSTGKYCRRVTCANEMDFLDDTRTAARIAAGSDNRSYMILQTLINAHNATVGANSPRAFTIGDFSAVASKYLTESIKFDYVTTLDALKKIFVETFGAEIRTRHVNGVNYIDIGKFGSTSSTVIKIGDNLQNIRATYSAADRIVTRLIPLGGVGYDGERLTIANAPGNPTILPYIDNAEMIAKYGIHEGVYIVNELAPQSERSVETLSQRLYEIGLAAAEALSTPAVEITLSALDLQKLGLSGYNGFVLGNTHLTICPKLGVHHDLRITGLKRKLSSPQTTELTISTINKRRDKANANLSAKLAAIDKNTNNKIDSNSYTYTSIVNNHFDGVENLKKVTKTQYDQTTKDPKTAYFVDDNGDYTLWLGDDQINLGGGGGTIEYAAVLTTEQQQYWIPGHDLVPVDFRGQAQVWYGQPPARFVCQGARMLYNVAQADITEDDIMSELALKYWDDSIQRVYIFIQNMFVTTYNGAAVIAIELGVDAYNVDAFGNETRIGSASAGSANYAYVPANYQKLTIGFVHTATQWSAYNGAPGPAGVVYVACMADDVMYRYVAMPNINGCFMNSSTAEYRVRRFANDAELHFAQALTITTEPTEVSGE